MTVLAFGEWDAPATDGAEWIDVPTNLTCMFCERPFEPGENGAVFPTGFAGHRECTLRNVWGGIGHLVDHERYCRTDPDAGLGYRESALLVWRHCVEKKPVTVDELERRAGRSESQPPVTESGLDRPARPEH